MPHNKCTINNVQFTKSKESLNTISSFVHFKLYVLHSKAGFTLIELMVVISIIAILSAAGIVLFQNSIKNARDGKRIGDIQEIQKGLEQYYSANGNAYPAALSSTNSYFSNSILPTDPTNSSPYTYTFDRNSNCSNLDKYIVCAKLENATGKANSDADATGNACNTPATTAPAYFCLKSLAN